MSVAYQKFVESYKCDAEAQAHLRLGQYFCNTYIKESFPELYYESDDNVAAEIIEKWLADHQYTEELPEPIDRTYLPH
jgi:hypothetical protein